MKSLEEEHNDLLGLLAQQELELSIFRDTLDRELGIDALVATEKDVQQSAIEKYGSYIDFRRNKEFNDLDDSIHLLSQV